MAGDWIPMSTDLWTCPEVVRILSGVCPQTVRTLSESVREKSKIIGALFRTWSLFDAHTDDGILHGYTADTLNSEVGIEGWAENLQHVGWLVINAQSLEMPGFDVWLSSSAKARLKERQRKRNERSQASGDCPDSVRKSADKKRTTVQDRREENKIEGKPSIGRSKFDPQAVTFPAGLSTPEFQAAWLDWCEARRENGKPLKPKAVEEQLRRCAEWGEAKAIDSIRASIANQWTGLFAAKTTQAAPPQTKQPKYRELAPGEIPF